MDDFHRTVQRAFENRGKVEGIKLLKFLNRKLERRGNNIGLTLKFPDNQCYHFICQKRAGVKNFVNKDGEVPFGCAKFAQKKVEFFS